MLSIKLGLFQPALFGGEPEEVYDRAQIDRALERKYDELGFWVA